jgi:homoserine O-acetyltransferase
MKLERALVIGVETDILFPLEQQQQLEEDLRATGSETTIVGLDSPQVDDAFLVDTGRFGAAIGAFMATL